MRTGSSFSFSIIDRDRAREQVAAAARAGVHHDLDRPRRLEALRERARAGAARRASVSANRNFVRRHALTLENAGISRISSANDSITAEIGLDDQDREAALRHHQRLAQRALHARRRARGRGSAARSGSRACASGSPAGRTPASRPRSNRLPGGAVDADDRHAEDERIEHVRRHAQHLREQRHQRQVEHQQHDVADVHARHQAPEQRRVAPG